MQKHSPPSSAEVKERVELYFYSPLWDFMACCRANFTFWMQKIFVTILYYNNLNIT